MAGPDRRTGARVLVLGLLAAGFAVTAQADAVLAGPHSTGDTREWGFRVYVGDREIGHHNFRVTGNGQEKRVEIDASFNVKFLFFNAFSYQHDNSELWVNGCLEGIDSSTQAGRKDYRVNGSAQADGFRVKTLAETFELQSDCVRSFAYWDPELLQSPRLLNAQTGEWIDIQPVEASEDRIEVMGRQVTARRLDLKLAEGTISLWYDERGTWLSLEAPAPGGRVLKYRAEQLPADVALDERVASR